MDPCQVEGCTRTVAKAGHHLCYDHWKAERSNALARCPDCGRRHVVGTHACAPTPIGPPSGVDPRLRTRFATRLRSRPGLSRAVPARTRRGPAVSGAAVGTPTCPTRRVFRRPRAKHAGRRAGAAYRFGHSFPRPGWHSPAQSGRAPHAGFVGSAPRAAPADAPAAPAPSPARGADRPRENDPSADFRARFPATIFTMDGRRVRSRAEALIDNWLYVQGLVHAYERRLPIEADCYCDCFLPGGRGAGGKGVYVEFWGRESDPAYRTRKAEKQAIYARHNLRLIELGDPDIERLDDVLPRALLRFGIDSV